MGAEALPLSLRLGPRPENTEENASSLKGNFILGGIAAVIFSAVIESVSAADLIYKELPSFDLRWDEYKGRQGVALVSGTNTTEGREVAALECPVEEEKKKAECESQNAFMVGDFFGIDPRAASHAIGRGELRIDSEASARSKSRSLRVPNTNHDIERAEGIALRTPASMDGRDDMKTPTTGSGSKLDPTRKKPKTRRKGEQAS
ncbi:hypothetical protein Salat_2988200 [Sesamum alatum]|uniref:Uncharacterized protein n=1 Tax=Sesamum alatum TaxID=300844 RepID=A0AAE1XHW9_9LAMI|nr:hypothetical protein Salat_2992900 [Sesamum alatum]KAK4412260.1 hypothetical protein Salat_2988200 [Sesamum alatum]